MTIRRSKADQEGTGRKIGLPWGSSPNTCPVRCVRAWLEAAAIGSGPVLRPVTKGGAIIERALSGRAVARILKRHAKALGLDPKVYAGHSLRAGLVTSAAKAGRSERAIMAQTGHRSPMMVRRYIRDADIWRENAAAGLL